MVKRNHVQLKEGEIADLPVCDNNEPNLKNFCGKRRPKSQKTMLRHRD